MATGWGDGSSPRAIVVGTSCPHPCYGSWFYARCLHNNRHYDRSEKFVASLREDRKMRVIKGPWLLWIMNFWRSKNLQNGRVAKRPVLEAHREVVVR